MARRKLTVTITTEGRDLNKSYEITEMPSAQAEWWATRAFLAISKNGFFEIPEAILAQGMVGLRLIMLRAFAQMSPIDAKPLLDEMFECIKFVPDIGRPSVVRPLADGDIEEVPTRIELRQEAFKLHVNFSTADVASTPASAAAQTTTSYSNTQTSPL